MIHYYFHQKPLKGMPDFRLTPICGQGPRAGDRLLPQIPHSDLIVQVVDRDGGHILKDPNSCPACVTYIEQLDEDSTNDLLPG